MSLASSHALDHCSSYELKNGPAKCVFTNTHSVRLKLVRNHAFDFRRIGIAHQSAFAQLLLPPLAFRGQDVAQVGMSALHLSAGGLFEALGRAFMCFQFRHKSSNRVSQ